ncbi:MAG TPA: hypothetical protein DHV85_07850 [Candidatus Accumulibacter sp.]|nr:hypothetical protein [Accumulibacter sp.]
MRCKTSSERTFAIALNGVAHWRPAFSTADTDTRALVRVTKRQGKAVLRDKQLMGRIADHDPQWMARNAGPSAPG